MPQIIDFVKQNEIDICQFQEVSGGSISADGTDNFRVLREEIGLKGEIIKTINQKDPDGYFANATLFRKDFRLIDKKVVWLQDFNPDYKMEKGMSSKADYSKAPRAALCLSLQIGDKIIHFINAHLTRTWDPYDSPQKLAESLKLIDFMQTLDGDLILSGDFNVVANTQIVRNFEQFGENLTKKFGIENTLNPKEHYLGEKVLENKLAVDFIFTSPSITVQNFHLLTHPTLSDHYGLFLECSL